MEKLGIELPLLLTQIVNFTIMIAILAKFLYKPILKALDERRQKIEDGLTFAQKAEEEKERLEQSRQKVLSKARTEAKQILEEAKKEGRKAKEDLLIQGSDEVSQLRIKLEKELLSVKQEITSEITAHTLDIAAEMVKQLIPDVINTSTQHKVLLEQLRRIEKKHEKKQ